MVKQAMPNLVLDEILFVRIKPVSRYFSAVLLIFHIAKHSGFGEITLMLGIRPLAKRINYILNFFPTFYQQPFFQVSKLVTLLF
jgi:hypothetical protein